MIYTLKDYYFKLKLFHIKGEEDGVGDEDGVGEGEEI